MVRIITDSTCDLDPAFAAEREIQVLPLNVSFGEEQFLDGVTLQKDEFFARLEQGVLPKTSQITPGAFQTAFQQALEAGDEVLYVGLSGELSGTAQSARVAKALLDGDERIHLIDSRTVTGGLGHLVTIAANLRDAGLSAAELEAKLLGFLPRMRFYAVVDTLKYLKLGGRISGAAAVVGGVMGIRPILTVEDGKVVSAGKVRSLEAGRRWHLGKLEEHPPAREFGVSFAYSRDREPMEVFRSEVLARDPKLRTLECSIGSVVGTYAGPGAFGVMYLEEV